MNFFVDTMIPFTFVFDCVESESAFWSVRRLSEATDSWICWRSERMRGVGGEVVEEAEGGRKRCV